MISSASDRSRNSQGSPAGMRNRPLYGGAQRFFAQLAASASPKERLPMRIHSDTGRGLEYIASIVGFRWVAVRSGQSKSKGQNSDYDLWTFRPLRTGRAKAFPRCAFMSEQGIAASDRESRKTSFCARLSAKLVSLIRRCRLPRRNPLRPPLRGSGDPRVLESSVSDQCSCHRAGTTVTELRCPTFSLPKSSKLCPR